MTTPPGTPEPNPQDPTPHDPAPQNPAQPRYGQNAPQAPAGGGQAGGYGQQPGPPQYGERVEPQYGQQQGQQQYGQQQYGQQQPNYGYQAAQPSGYTYPGAPAAAATKGPAPQKVVIAYWLIIAAGLVFLLSTILSSMNPLATLDPSQIAQLETAGFTAESLAGTIATLAIIFGIVFTAIYVLLAVMIRKGKNWARITATVLAGLSLLSLGGGALAALSVLLGVAGVILCYLKPTNEYFAPRAPRY